MRIRLLAAAVAAGSVPAAPVTAQTPASLIAFATETIQILQDYIGN